MHSHRDFAFNTEVYAKRTVGYRRDDVTVSVPRLFFGYATGTNLWFPFAVGATVGLFSERPTAGNRGGRDRALPADHRHERADDARQAARSRRRAAREAASPASTCRACAFTSRPARRCPEPLLRRFTERFGAEVYDGIGSAEMFHIYCSNRPGDVKPGSLGRVVEGYTLAILPEGADAAGAPRLPAGEIGVLWVKGDSVAQGYFQDREKSWKTFHGHWCRTGDLFSIDEQGYLWFQGRADDLLKVGGVFVAPREVEDCLLAHAAVSVCCGHSVGRVVRRSRRGRRPDQAQGVDRAAARCPPTDRHRRRRRTLVAELRRTCRRGCPSTSIRAGSSFVDDLPKNDRGKVDKKSCSSASSAAS